MKTLHRSQLLSVAFVGAAIATLSGGLPTPAATFNPAPLFDATARYSTTIPRIDGGVDPADIYYPVLTGTTTAPSNLPIALMLPGSLVSRADYTNFANIVARYGFTVIVPDHARTLFDPVAGPVRGLFPEQQQVHDTLSFLQAENHNPTSPLTGRLNPGNLSLLGHSFGGAVGLASVQNACIPILCTQTYTRPAELKAGVFFGAPFFDPRFQNTIPPINNFGVPVALIAGSRDGVAPLPNIQATYNQIQALPKALVTVGGANHYGITNDDNLFREPTRPTLEQAVTTETIARWSALFLRANALGDEGAFNYVFYTGDALDPNVTATAAVPEPATIMGVLVFAGGSVLLKRRQPAKGR